VWSVGTCTRRRAGGQRVKVTEEDRARQGIPTRERLADALAVERCDVHAATRISAGPWPPTDDAGHGGVTVPAIAPLAVKRDTGPDP
jgi:hypothetical protein